MARIQIDIPDTIATRVMDAVCAEYGYSETITPYDPSSGTPTGGTPKPNPLTKPQFVKRVLADFLKNTVRSYEARTAADTARKNAEAAADKDITLS